MAEILNLLTASKEDVFEAVTKKITEEKAELLKDKNYHKISRPMVSLLSGRTVVELNPRIDPQFEQAISSTADILLEFCRDVPAFAERVLSSNDKTLEECLKAAFVNKDTAEDAVYTRAAQYYAPGCAIEHVRKLILDPANKKISGPGEISWLDFL